MLLKKDTGLVKALFTKRGKHTKPKNPLPLLPIPQEELLNASHDVIYRLGHSTVLMRQDSKYFLTDPVFSETASPLRWPSLGLKRFQPTPISIGELPSITAVLISHDHYDHLDRRAIQQLIGRTGKFVVPVGVGNRLRRWGVPSEKIIERDWWQSVSFPRSTLRQRPRATSQGVGCLTVTRARHLAGLLKALLPKYSTVVTRVISQVSMRSESASVVLISLCWKMEHTARSGRIFTCHLKKPYRRTLISREKACCPSIMVPLIYLSMLGLSRWNVFTNWQNKPVQTF